MGVDLKIPLMAQVEEQIAVVVDKARLELLTEWTLRLQYLRDKCAPNSESARAYEKVRHEMDAARLKIRDAVQEAGG